MALTVSQKTAKKKKPFIRWVLKIEVCSCAAILKKKTAKNNSRFQVFEFPILVSWLIDAVSAFIPPRQGLGGLHRFWKHLNVFKTIDLLQNIYR